MSDTTDAKKILLEQAKALDLEVDGRWSVETLAEKVQEAQQAQNEQEERAVDQARKIPVLMKRNGFVTATRKVLKGQIAEVPIDTARAWIKAGAAERADPLPGD